MKSLVNFVVLASFLLGGSLPTGTAAAQDGGPIYIVLEGDTLSSIAIEFGTTVDALVQTNAIADASLIAPGMRLVIPGFEGVNGLLGVHEVVFGESLASLAASVHASAPSLAKLNRLVSPGRLYVGQPAILPESESGAPAAAVAHLLEPGQGRLAAAVAFGVNPWTVSGSPASLWVVPGSRIYLPGGPSPAKDLPSGLDSVGVDPSPVIQGRTTVIELQADPEAAVEARLGESAVNLMSAEDTPGAWVALQGIHALQSPGLLDLEVRVSVDGRTDGFRQPVRVLEAGYGRESLEVPQETLDPANTGPEDARVAEIVRPATRERLWAGLFSFPSTYFETFPSRFGTRRSYNGSAYSYYHTGLDLYGNPETPVLAPAPGIVVFTEKLTVRGNTTYVDHGWGVYSGFLHQSQILVQPGDRVETGEVIGMVGATGRVTGAHLHWEVWVGGVPINPLEWTERPLP
jgi:murein DD-endopeptidase MepM/ murein hydrolase activator NlpD